MGTVVSWTVGQLVGKGVRAWQVEDAGARLGGRDDGHKDQIIRLELVIRQSLKGVDGMAQHSSEVRVSKFMTVDGQVTGYEMTPTFIDAAATAEDVDRLIKRAALELHKMMFGSGPQAAV